MPPKDENKAADMIAGFDSRETKLLAAAFVASTGLLWYNYDLMATLTGNTAGSLKKMFPPIKRKAVEAHPSFASFLGTPVNAGDGETKAAAAPKTGGKKRKATSEPEDTEVDKELEPEVAKGDEKTNGKAKAEGKKAAAKPRGRPKKTKAEKEDAIANGKEDVKKEPTPEEGEAKVEEDEV